MMFYNFLSVGVVADKDIVMPELRPEILSGIVYCRMACEEVFKQITFLDGYYTALKFPLEAADSTTRKAQRMNYEYCIRTMAELMKKYAPELLS